MDDLILTRDLVAQGYSMADITRLARRDDLVRLRRGAYVAKPPADPAEPQGGNLSHRDLHAEHRRLLQATLAQLHPGYVFSHVSAAALHQLPLFAPTLGLAHLTRDRRGGGAVRRYVRVHGSPLRTADRSEIDGYPVTSLARTVSDLSRTLRFDQAVAVGDGALRLGLEHGLLGECLEQAAGWSGISQARRTAGFLDGRAESVGESFSRVLIVTKLLLPAPELQYEVFDDGGHLIGRCDFAWPRHRTLGEFDGMVKYGRLRRPGETVQEAVIREKRREDALRDHGWQVVRWTWDELWSPQLIADRIARAFARGTR